MRLVTPSLLSLVACLALVTACDKDGDQATATDTSTQAASAPTADWTLTLSNEVTANVEGRYGKYLLADDGELFVSLATEANGLPVLELQPDAPFTPGASVKDSCLAIFRPERTLLGGQFGECVAGKGHIGTTCGIQIAPNDGQQELAGSVEISLMCPASSTRIDLSGTFEGVSSTKD